MATVMIEVEIQAVEAWRCDGCEAISETEPESPLYECGNCGTTFTRENSYDGESHRCPDCMKFSTKISDHGCPECGAGEMVKVELMSCPGCDEMFETEDELTDHLHNELRSH